MTDTTVAASTTLAARLSMSGEDTLIVDAGGVFSVSANSQTVRFNGATDGASIENNGLIENTADGGRAIRFETSVGATLAATIENNGQIESDDDAIQIQAGAVTAGEVTITNTGDIESAIGQAIDFAGGTGDFIAIVTNSGNILGATNDGLRVGGVGDIDNSGTIYGGSGDDLIENADGVQFEEGSSGSVNNLAGIILGDRHGVNADEDTVITVDNAEGAEITGSNGSGVGSDGSATVTNHGTITGSYTEGVDVNGPEGEVADGIYDGDGDGVDIDFEATIHNYGVIQGLGANGNGSDGYENTSEGIAAGGGSIYNYDGATISGLGLGILIDDSSRGNASYLTTIVNEGSITGVEDTGIKIVSDLDDTISNGGTITGGNGMAVVFGTGDNTFAMTGDQALVDGSVTGGDGVDTLDYSDYGLSVAVNLGTGAATAIDAVSGFEIVLGGSLADSLTGSASVDTLQGGGGADSLFGGADNDVLNGDDGQDTLNGGLGDDTLQGGAGNDTYQLTNADGDVIVEDSNAGVDLIVTRFSIDLGDYANVENVDLNGKASVDIEDNDLDNVLRGNNRSNDIETGLGNDKIYGEGGSDLFHFAAYGADNSDRVMDFDGNDAVALDRSVFSGLARTAGHLVASDFVAGSAAKIADEAAVIYNSKTGILSYDADGKGGDAAEAIAFIGKKLENFDFNDILLL
ncbi:calcium-binding protein [Rhizobium sp. FKL33]|uniref:calcium-binding protein n=1 Tax=Rhizobium sp. FKL33 TaxID=2562307 RepID=UPI0010C12B3C|nr:calcium-binding protein [Rhizobium sp. FKL33]